jgi:hypothetical protein
MGEILGIGATHYPPGLVPDEYKPWPLARMLKGDRIPAHMKDPATWPHPCAKSGERMRESPRTKPSVPSSLTPFGRFERKLTP